MIRKIKKNIISKNNITFFFLFFLICSNHLLFGIDVNTPLELINAINSENAGPSGDGINFTGNITLTAANSVLPPITNTYNVNGATFTLDCDDGVNKHRGFTIFGATSTIRNMTITNAIATGGSGSLPFQDAGGSGGGGLGAGGAIYVGQGATATADNITFTNCGSIGGNSPNPTGAPGGSPSSGGGGGGFGGDGSNVISDGGGGGGYLENEDAAGQAGSGAGSNGALVTGTDAIPPPSYGGGGGGGSNGAGNGAPSGYTSLAFVGGGGGGASIAGTNNNHDGASGGFGSGGGGGGGVAFGSGGGTITLGTGLTAGSGANGAVFIGGRGGGGSALGGTIFVDDTSTFTLKDSLYDISGSSVTPGTGNGSTGSGGIDIFLANGGNLQIESTGTMTILEAIQSNTGSGGDVKILGGGIVDFGTLTNTFEGTLTISNGTVQFVNTTALGNGTTIIFDTPINTKVLQDTNPAVGPQTLSNPITMSGEGTIKRLKLASSTDVLRLTGQITGSGNITSDSIGAIQPTNGTNSFSGEWVLDGQSLPNRGNLFFASPDALTSNTISFKDTNYSAGSKLGGALWHIAGASQAIPNNIRLDSGDNGILVESGTTLTLNGQILGFGNITFDQWDAPGSTGICVLNNSNSYTGSTKINSGTLRSSIADALSNSSSVKLYPFGRLEITVSQEIKNFSGTGILLLNQPPAQTLTLNQITTPLTFSENMSGSGALTKTGSGTLICNYPTMPFAANGKLTINQGTLEINSPVDLISNFTSVTIDGGSLDLFVGTGPKTINSLGGSGGGINLNNNTLTINQNASYDFDGVISGSGSIIKDGSNNVGLAGINTYTGSTTIKGGSSLTIVSTGDISSSSAVILNDAGSSLYVNTLGTPKEIKNLEDDASGTFIDVFQNTLTINQNVDKTYSGVISSSGGGGNITKDGANELRLDGTNTYAGTTKIDQGKISLTSSGSISFSSLEVNSLGVFNIEPFVGAKEIKSLSGSAGPITLNSNDLTIDQTSSNSYSGIISGTGSRVTKNGINDLSFSAASKHLYSGETVINAGKLILASAGASIEDSSLVVINGGTLELTSSVGSKTIKTLQGTSGIIDLNDNILTVIQQSVATFSGDITSDVSGDARFTLDASSTSTLTLDGNNTYIGTTIIDGSRLIIRDNGSIGVSDLTINSTTSPAFTILTTGAPLDKSILTLRGGVGAGDIQLNQNDLTVNQLSSQSYPGALIGTGSFIKNGSQTLQLTSSSAFSSYFGNLTIDQGTLELNSTADLISDATSVTIDGGSLEITNATAAKSIKTLSGTGGGINLNNNNLTINQNSNQSYAGVISGLGKIVKDGASDLTLSGTNTFSGGLDLKDGALLISANANLGTGLISFEGATLQVTDDTSITNNINITYPSTNTLNVATDKTLTLETGTITATSNLTKTGTGTLIINKLNPANNLTTTINAGNMIVNGGASWSSSSFTAESGTSISGNGTIIGDVTNNGTISPGASIGTLNIVGSYVENGTLDIEITSFPNVSDKIIVTGGPGTVTLNPSSVLNIIPLSDTEFFAKGTTYDIISSSGPVGGAFGSFQDPDAALYFHVLYETNRVILVVTNNLLSLPIHSEITNPNAIAVGEYLENCCTLNNLDFINVYTSLASLDIEGLTDALLQISPVRFGALKATNFTNNQIVSKIFTDHFRKVFRCKNQCEEDIVYVKPNSFEIWAEPFAYFTNQRVSEGLDLRPYNNKVFGGVIGGDYNCSNRMHIGAAIGYSYADIHWRGNLGNADINSIYAGIYGSYHKYRRFFNLSILGTKNFFNAHRKIRFGTSVDRTAKHNHKGFDIAAHIGGGLDFSIKNGYYFQPTIDLDYTYDDQKGFKEKGADFLNLQVDATDFSNIRFAGLFNFIKDLKYQCTCLSPAIRIGYIYEDELSSSRIKSNLYSDHCNSCNNFSVKTYHKGHNKGVIGTNLTGIRNNGFNFYVNYQFEFGKHFYQNLAAVRFEWNY